MSILITFSLCLKVIILHKQWTGLLHETVEFGSARLVHLVEQPSINMGWERLLPSQTLYHGPALSK